MLSQNEFEVLHALQRSPGSSQRALAAECGLSLGTVNRLLKSFQDNGWTENGQLTEDGLTALAPYKVDNAIILAAGMSTRFIPISYELPKGLISVKGEVLIERLIRQLQESGIREVVLVVGYMMEKFLYLRDKYNVKLVVNNEYTTKNTHSSIYAARDYLGNTYICCSDNYYPENPFRQYEYRAFYCSIYLPGTSYVERAFTFDSKGLIIDTNKPSHDQWIMYGHAYYDHKFTAKFKPILKSYYGRPGVENMYWETIYAENVDKLPMYVRQCQPEEILEFDSMEELQAYDSDYIQNNHIKIFENICRVLNCQASDIQSIESIKSGLNNRSFKFCCKGSFYVYRHPGINAQNVIDRRKEAIALRAAKSLGIDETLVEVDEEEGWKISRFVDVDETFDFGNKTHIWLLSDHLKTLHSANVSVGYRFDYGAEADRLLDTIKLMDSNSYRHLQSWRKTMEPIMDYLKANPWQVSLCHNDIYAPNLLLHGGQLELIDWEFAGDADIGFDICKLFSVHDPSYEELDEWLHCYYGRNTSQQEKMHLLACAAIIYYYWFVWGIYASKNTESVSDYLLTWHDKMDHFSREFLTMLRADNK